MSRLRFLTAAVLLALAGWPAASPAAGAEGTASAAPVPPVPSPTASRKIDEYGDIRFSDEKMRLDNFAIELLSVPAAKGYIIAYGGRRAREGEARRRMERARRYVMAARKVPASRLVTIDGGHREELTVELYIIPSRTTPPQASPTVDPAEVEITRGRPNRRGRGSRARTRRPA